MKPINYFLLTLFGLAAFVVNSRAPTAWAQVATSQSAPSPDPRANETKAQRDARMKWWREARFGMFIHWGLYAVPAGRWNGGEVPGAGINVQGYGEWLMHNAQIPVAQYAALAPQFDPTQFNAERWVGYAKAAGMKYIIVTAKHHDGFAMYPSKASRYNIRDATPFERDPLAELKAACEKQGIKFGIYYSQNLDWSYPGGGMSGEAWDPAAQNGSFHDYVKNLAAPQVDELLTNYKPAVLWWDIPGDLTPDEARALTASFNKAPGLIANDRMGGGVPGDTSTPEQYIPATGLPHRDWEVCMTMNDTWGYKVDDHNFKSSASLIRNLIDIASKGGNYLLNVGPDANGVIPSPEVERLAAIGAWMDKNGESIYATTPSPFKRLSWGRATTKREGDLTTLYLHVWDWPANGKLLVPGLQNAPRRAYLLNSKKGLTAIKTADGVTISLPPTAPDAVSSTIALEFAGAPIVVAPPIVQNADGTLQLAPIDATTHGAISVEQKTDGKDNFGFWLNPTDFVEWDFRAVRAGQYEVTAEVAAPVATSLNLMVNAQSNTVAVPATGDYGKFQRISLGKIVFDAPGPMTLKLKPGINWNAINLRAVNLRPMK